MGIFNEQSSDNSFAKGIQGAPGVGFNLTADGNYDISNKKLTNVGTPSDNTDAATKKYVDDNSSGSPSTSRLTIDSNIDMKNTYRITNLKTPQDSRDPATKYYVDNTFLDTDGSYPMKGNLNMANNKIVGLTTPTSNTDAATKKYVDDTGVGNITKDIDLKYSYNIKNSKKRTFNQLKAATESLVSYEEVRENFIGINEADAMKTSLDMGNNFIYNVKTPTNIDQAVNKSYVDTTVSNKMLTAATKQELVDYLKKDGSVVMTGNLNMDNNRIYNLPTPTGAKQPTPLAFTDIKYLHVAGTNKMLNSLNMDNKSIINLRTPTSDSDAATKKYVDDNSGNPDLNDYLEKDGTVPMTGELNLNGNKIIKVGNPIQNSDATNKDYVDEKVHSTSIQPSHYKDQFSYLMSSSNQWTDEIDGGNSFNITKIGDLSPSNGNFHDYNHKVLFMEIYKNYQGGYKYQMGINFYRLVDTDYTLCLELLNTDYQLWHKSQISVVKGSSTGLSIKNESIKKLSHRYTDSKGQSQFMYYHRIIVSFKKLSSGNKFFLHILVNIPQTGTDLAMHPRPFSGVYMIAYGIVGTVSNIDPDKTYDYHTAFDIKPTEVEYNVDINANQKSIKNVKLDQSSDNNVATIGLVKTLIPHIYNNLYREIFEEYYDFSDASIYGVSRLSSGVIINSFKPNITIPNKDLSIIKENGINVNRYNLTFNPSNHTSKYSLCIVFTHWRNRNFSLAKVRRSDNKTLTSLYYMNVTNTINLVVNNITRSFTVLSSFNGKRIVLFLTENFDSNITKFKMSNYSSTLTIPSVHYSNDQYWKFTTDDGVLYRIMSSPKFYDFDSDEYHKLMIQEKLNGSYIE